MLNNFLDAPAWNERLKKHPRLASAILALIAVVAYHGAIRNTFVYDDEPQILFNPFVYNARLWTRIFTGSVWSFNSATARDNFYRPLQMFYYWALYHVAGPNPAVFHLAQVLIYAAAAILVYRLGCEVFDHPAAAMVGAILWVLHPLHVEPVAWISGMADAGAGFFVLLGFVLFVRAERSEERRSARHIGAALAYLPALFFKESALTFPLLLLAYWLILAQPKTASLYREWAGRARRLVPYAAAVAAYLAVRLVVIGSLGRSKSLFSSLPQTLAAGFGLLGQHARLFIWPVGLNPFRTFDFHSALRSPWPWVALAMLALALAFRKRDRQLSFLVAWWAVTLLPCLDIRQLSVPQIADRFSYIPSVGLCLAISLALIVRLGSRAPATLAGASAPALALLMIFWGHQTFKDIPHWRDTASLIRNGFERAPDDAALHNVRGDFLRFVNRDLAGAEREYRRALELDSRASVKSLQVKYDSYFGLGGVAQELGRDQEALADYHRAADIMPGLSPAYDALGAYYFPRHDYQTASQYFVRAVAANPQDVDAHVYLGHCWMKLKKYQQAAEEFRAARTIDPSLTLAYQSESRALEAAKSSDK